MTRVLHVFSTFGPGGPQVRTAELMRGLGDGFGHAVAAMDGRTDTLELCPPGVRTVATPRGVRGVRALLAFERPDLLCTYNWGALDALVAARLAGRRAHVHHEDGFNADEAVRRKRRRGWARRLVLGRVHRVIVPSRGLARIARREWGVREERVALIVNGVDTSRFTPEGPGRDELRASLGIPRGAPVVGAVGHLRPVKRYDRLLRAARALEGAHLVLVGDGPEREALEALARECAPPGGGVHLAGHQVELAPWYRTMDVLCVSSDSEQLPVTVLEALACGLPVCGTDVGDVRHAAPEEGRDLFVPPGEPEALGAVIAGVLGDADLRRRLSAAGVERARGEYSLETMVEAYRAVYRGALG